MIHGIVVNADEELCVRILVCQLLKRVGLPQIRALVEFMLYDPYAAVMRLQLPQKASESLIS